MLSLRAFESSQDVKKKDFWLFIALTHVKMTR